MRGKGFQKWSHLWSNFGALFGPKMVPKMAPEFVKKVTFVGGHFFDYFFGGVGALLMHLRNLLGPSQAVLEGLGHQKY